MSGLSREVIKWLQSLDLTWQIKTPKWDLTNGYLIAEIFSWYFPQEIQMHMYNNGTSLDSKQKNWSLLQNFFKRHKLEISEEFVDGTIHCKEGAAPLLVERIYQILTNREVKQREQGSTDYTDRAYQAKLPLHARSTASQAVKNNIRVTELMADKNIILNQQKAQTIINSHIDHRMVERLEDPMRFDRKPTLGELALRRPPTPSREPSEDGGEPEEELQEQEDPTSSSQKTPSLASPSRGTPSQASRQSTFSKEGKIKHSCASEPDSYKEMDVNQPSAIPSC